MSNGGELVLTILTDAVPADLAAFLAEPRDSREYRQEVAVKLALQGMPYAQICTALGDENGTDNQAHSTCCVTNTLL